MYIIGAMIMLYLVPRAYRKFKESNAASEKAAAEAKTEAIKRKRMLDMQTLHQLKEMGLA